jgi:ankyrin repeat protein
MKRSGTFVLGIALLAILTLTGLPSAAAAETIDIWTAAATGDLDAINAQLAARTDVNARAPSVGVTPLMAAAITGQTDAAKLLLDKGAKPDLKSSKDGAAALHMAAFFGHVSIVKALLGKGAYVRIKNDRSETPLDTVSADWSEES